MDPMGLEKKTCSFSYYRHCWDASPCQDASREQKFKSSIALHTPNKNTMNLVVTIIDVTPRGSILNYTRTYSRRILKLQTARN